MNHTEIVNKLIGDITPTGKSEVDEERFKNLKAMCLLVDELVYQIVQVAYKNECKNEHSMKEMGVYARDFLTKTLGIPEDDHL